MAIGEVGPGGHLLTAWNLADVPLPATALANLRGLPLGDSGWTNVTSFTNGWSNFGSTSFMLIGKVVYLRGVMNAGTANTVAFTLPSGYWPSATMSFPVWTNSGTTINIVIVSTTGTVTPVISAGTWLSGVTFPIV